MSEKETVKKDMVKRNIVFTTGVLERDESKNRFTGFVNGQYTTMTQAKDGKWYLNSSLSATIFESNIPKMDAANPL